MQHDPRFTQQYFKLSPDKSARGPWNQGEIPGMGKDLDYIENPLQHVKDTKGLSELPEPMEKELEETEQLNQHLSKEKSQEVKKAEQEGIIQWSDYAKTKEQ